MRTKNLVYVSLLLGSLMFVGAGCGQKTSVSTDAATGSNAAPAANKQPAPAPAEVSSTTTSDSCGNPYYPFKPGLTITYTVTPPVPGDSDHTMRIEKVTGNTASIHTEMDGGTTDLEAECANGSIVMKGSLDSGPAGQGTKYKATVVAPTGIFMPADARVGSTWKNSGTLKMEPISGTASDSDPGAFLVTSTEQGRAVSEESVTVPAGTFQALKVELTTTSIMDFSNSPAYKDLPPEMKPPSTLEQTWTSTEWWVKGVGMVKTTTKREDRSATTVAKSITGL